MVAGIFLVIGVVFALCGAYASLADVMPAWQAGGLVGLGALVLCVVLLIAARATASRGRRRQPAPRTRPTAEDLEATAELGAAASAAARDLVRQYRPTGLELSFAALVVGLLVSRRSRRRPKRRI